MRTSLLPVLGLIVALSSGGWISAQPKPNLLNEPLTGPGELPKDEKEHEKALTEAGGDFAKAEDILRKSMKGKMDAKTDRPAGAGPGEPGLPRRRPGSR